MTELEQTRFDKMATAEHTEQTVSERQAAQLSSSLAVSRYMMLFAGYIVLAGWMVNYDISYGGSVLQMESFRKTFGSCKMVPNPKTGHSQESAP